MSNATQMYPAAGAGDRTIGKFSWSLYDFANSAFTTVIITFVYSAFFQQGIAPSETEGTQLWGRCLFFSGIAIAILAPILGSIADHTGRRKPWIGFFTIMCIICTFALFWIEPNSVSGTDNSGTILIALILVALANIGYEMGIVFYNAMLPDVVEQSSIGRWSGFAWGLGYFGGLICLLMCLVLFVNPDPALFGLDKAKSEHIRGIAPFIALWTLVFSLPLFLFTKDTARGTMSYGEAISRGINDLIKSLVALPKRPKLFRFLIAHVFYRDGLNTLLQMGGLFAAAVYGMNTAELLTFGMILNVTAALGCFLFGWLDDKYGSRRVLIWSIIGLSAFSIIILLASDKTIFYIVAAALGIFVGPIQSSSRTMIGRLAEKDKLAETYGLFAFSGKSTSFLGPLMVGELTYLFGNRVGMGSLMIFLIVGLLLMIYWVDAD